MDVVIKAIKWILENRSFFSKLLQKLRRTSSAIFPQDMKTTQRILTQLEELNKLFEDISASQLEKIEQEIPDVAEVRNMVREFLNDYIPIWVEGRLGIISKKISAKDILKKFNEIRDKVEPKEVLIPLDLPLSQAEDFISFRETPKPIHERLIGIIGKLDQELKSLVYLSAHIEELYKIGMGDKAEGMKRSVRARYNEFGTRFCNLYQRYLKKLLLRLENKPPNELNAEVRKFVAQDTKNIFFIHKLMKFREMREIGQLLQEAVNLRAEYIAIHSLSGAIIIAKTIATGIETEGYEIVTIDTLREFSKIWYKGKGKRILDYFAKF